MKRLELPKLKLYNKKKRFVVKNDHLFTHESENGEYGNEQSFQYQKEGLDLEFFDTQSNNVDYLWKCCIEHGMRHVMEHCHNNLIHFLLVSQKKAVTLHPNNYQFHSQLFEHL